MKYYLVCPIGVIGGREDLLTYGSESELTNGVIVKIPFGKQIKLGVVIKATTKPSFVTKPITASLSEVVPAHLLALSLWMSEFYAVRRSMVLQTMLPSGMGKSRRSKERPHAGATRTLQHHPLTQEQSDAIQAINSSSAITHLLHGVTGSGKTRVYQELAKKTLAEQKSVLVLVPEIALTPQLAAEFESLHHNVLVLHSGLTEAERHINWQRLSTRTMGCIGPRSILFSPLHPSV
ncbi:MAG: DEAD/DEAH box helicase family protein [Candidatus Saccharimonadales bacterium]